MKDWPTATNAKEVHSFLGLASYYWRLIPKYYQMACCLHKLVGPMSKKTKKTKSQKKGKTVAKPYLTEEQIFEWTLEHVQTFDVLKEAIVTALVLGYSYFNREFMLETNASLQGLGAMLSKQDESAKICVIAYMSHSSNSSKRSMCHYSSVKLELLLLKWVVTEKFHDYLLGSKFHMYTENNPLAYVRVS